jgi:hypothetical protein
MNRRERIVAVFLLGLRGHEYRTPEEIRNVTGLPWSTSRPRSPRCSRSAWW